MLKLENAYVSPPGIRPKEVLLCPWAMVAECQLRQPIFQLRDFYKNRSPSLQSNVYVYPSSVLLPPARRPLKLKRCHARLASSYPCLVARNCAAGLQRLARGRRVHHHNGKRMVRGAFGVRNNSEEDRVISDLPVN